MISLLIESKNNEKYIIIVKNYDLKKLNKKLYLNDIQNIDIIEKYPISINKKICSITSDCFKHLHIILRTLFTELSPEILIWVSVNLKDNNFTEILKKFVENGFNSPHISTINPFKKNIEASIVLCRQNIPSDPHISNMTFNKIYYCLQQYKSGLKNCFIIAKLSTNAIHFLKESSKKGFTLNSDGKKTQKELTGELYVKNILNKNKNIVYIIDIQRDSIRSGEEESVSVSPTRYNFHSHPEEAYVRHSVKTAWPSVTDYLGYLKLGENTIFHCVATLEGVYILSFSEYWCLNIKKISKNFIEKNFDIDHNEDYTPKTYVKKVNSILYKKYPIFNIKFFYWKESNKEFKIYFSKTGNSCLPSQQIIEKYKKIY